MKYVHNYPAYYLQSFSNPQQSWAYPDEALPLFRMWFKEEYLASKFPQYLLKKVEQGLFPKEKQQQIVRALLPN